MQYDMYGNPVAQQRMGAAQLQDSIQTRQLALAQQRAHQLVAKYNKNPKAMNQEEVMQAKAMGQTFGYDTRRGDKKDTAGVWDAILGFGGGALDSILLGILKDEWYTNRRNGDYATAGKIAGIIGSIAVGGVPGLAKGAAVTGKGIAGTLSGTLGSGKAANIANKVLTGYMKYGTAPGATRNIVNATKTGLGAIKAANAPGGGLEAIRMAIESNPNAPRWLIEAMINPGAAAKGVVSAALPYAAGGIGTMGLLGQAGRSFSGGYQEDEMLPQIPMQGQY
jgi:hypothetical protein